jgi:hypothetical protein
MGTFGGPSDPGNCDIGTDMLLLTTPADDRNNHEEAKKERS